MKHRELRCNIQIFVPSIKLACYRQLYFFFSNDALIMLRSFSFQVSMYSTDFSMPGTIQK